MTKSRPKKPISGKPGGNPGLINRFSISPWKALRVWLVVAVVAAIVLLRSLLGNIIFETIGFGVVLGLLWLGIIALVILQYRGRSLIKWWNFWFGAFLFTLAAWGILSLFYPAGLTLTDVEFNEVSLGGTAGASFIGSQGVGAHPALRLTVLILAGVSLIIPYLSLRLVQRLILAVMVALAATIAGVRWLLPRLAHRVSKYYHKYPVHKLMAGWITTVGKGAPRRQIKQPDKTANTLPAEMKAAEIKAEPTATTSVQLPLQPAMNIEETAEPHLGPAIPGSDTAGEQLPSIKLLERAAEVKFAEADSEQRARLIEESLISYGVEAKVVQINPGPSVTQFGIEPGWVRKYRRVAERDQQGKVKLDKDGKPIERLEEVSKIRVKVERITALANNLALALATPNIRIEAPVPGQPVVGIEVPNTTTSLVRLRGLMESPAFQRTRARSKLALALGNATGGEAVAADLAKMPHLLIAGTTGSGKTVCINSIITCLLMCNSPKDIRLLLIDPKRVELVSFNGIPHLMAPVVVEVDKAIDTLRRVLREMDNRFTKFAAVGARNIEGYNSSPLVTEAMSYLIVIVDELADLMMTAAEVVEPSICRLAQLSRATGIHLVLATQRPSVDVVTGLIKANFPTRISFAVASAVDSRTIIDIGGAEKLLGQGDMLYVPPDASKPRRLRGCFVSDQEIDRVVNFWKHRHDIYPSYLEDAVAQAFASLKGEESRDDDSLLSTARRLAKEHSHLSTSLLQRRLHI
ncbi:MAG: DNA translocase FtsK, partial [Dehalococcoidia bacterium]